MGQSIMQIDTMYLLLLEIKSDTVAELCS